MSARRLNPARREARREREAAKRARREARLVAEPHMRLAADADEILAAADEMYGDMPAESPELPAADAMVAEAVGIYEQAAQVATGYDYGGAALNYGYAARAALLIRDSTAAAELFAHAAHEARRAAEAAPDGARVRARRAGDAPTLYGASAE